MNDLDLIEWLDRFAANLHQAIDRHEWSLKLRETGRLQSIGQGTARVVGLPSVGANELIRFPGDRYGMAFNLDPEAIGVVLLDRYDQLEAGDRVVGTGRVVEVPVGEALLGRVVDGLGRPVDNRGRIFAKQRLPIERPAPAIVDRAPVTQPLQTGIKVIDGLIPIGRGQRELILGDRQTGKTGIAVDAMINQRDKDVLCIYCAVGQRSASIARVIDDLRRHKAIEHTIVIATTEDHPPGEVFIAPYAAMSMAEFFMEGGRDVLVVLDDLTRHARAYREISLLLRRPPGREAFPGDIFYIHSRLLERSTHLRDERGGGSVTTLPIVETEAQNVSAYIPTNLISITDGQVYLSPDLFDKGVLPAVDVGKSVSRVGGKTQWPAYRRESSHLRLAYSQFEELEAFARFGTRLDSATQAALERGRRTREVLKQPQYQPMPALHQIAIFMALNDGLLDPIPVERVVDAERRIAEIVDRYFSEYHKTIPQGAEFSEEDRNEFRERVTKVLEPWSKSKS